MAVAVAVGSLKSLTTEHAESADRATNRGKEETLKFNKIPTKFRILRGGVPSGGQNRPVEKHFRSKTSGGSAHRAI